MLRAEGEFSSRCANASHVVQGVAGDPILQVLQVEENAGWCFFPNRRNITLKNA